MFGDRVWGSCVRSLVRRIGFRVIEQSSDNRTTQFLIQKIAIDVQRGNAASVMATIPSSQHWVEFASLPSLSIHYCFILLSFPACV